MSLLCRSCSFLGGGPDVQKTVVFHSCSSCLVVYMPVVVHDKFCWCRSCRSLLVVDTPVMVLRPVPRFSLFGRHRDSPVACGYGGRCPCLQVVHILRCCLCEDSRDPTVQLVVIPVVAQMQIPMVRFTLRLSSCSTLTRWSTLCSCCARLQVPGAVVDETVETSPLPLLRKPSFPGGPGQGC